MGVVLEIKEPVGFKRRYLNFIEEIKSAYQISSPRNVFKSYELKRKLGLQDFEDVAQNFVNIVIADSCRIHIVFASFNTKKVEKVIYYRKDRRKRQREKKTIEFLRHLSSYFPYVAAWSAIFNDEAISFDNIEIHLDSFDGEVTYAWEILKNNISAKIKTFPKGDQCNPFISASDIVLSLVEINLLKGDFRLDVQELKKLLEKYNIKGSITHCGTNKIKYITPISSQKIPEALDYAEPVIYVVPGQIKKEWIENSPKFEYVLKYAQFVEGGVKFLNIDRDYEFIRDTDVLAYFDDAGKVLAKNISSLYDVECKSISEIINETKY